MNTPNKLTIARMIIVPFSCNISSDRMGRRSQSLHFSDSVCGRKRYRLV